MVNHMIAHRVIPEFRKRREAVWRRVWAKYAAEEMDFATFLTQFYKTVLHS
jgi:hypothetical protein